MIEISELLTSYEKTKEGKDGVPPDHLKTAFDAAITSLTTGFGVTDLHGALGQGAGGLSDEYAKMFEGVAENFSTLFAELNKMRSSYLPIELIEGLDSEGVPKTIEEVVDTQSILESYENTFFRMLGMPSTADLDDNMKLTTVDETGKYVSDQFKSKYEPILDKRQIKRSERPGAPTNSIYDFVSGSQSAIQLLESEGFTKSEELKAVLASLKFLYDADEYDAAGVSTLTGLIGNIGDETVGSTYSDLITADLETYKKGYASEDGEEATASPELIQVAIFSILKNSLMHIDPTRTYSISTLNSLFNEFITLKPDVNLMHLNKAEVFWEFSHLLFPPVQDGRIAKCINEPAKMVAEPFTPNILRTINGHKMKSTLLEAVIRIRLDIISGTQIASPNTEPGSVRPPITAGNFSVPVSHESVIERMGLIESLIIVRLFTAVQGFAFDVYNRIGDMVSLQHQNGNVPGGEMAEDNQATAIEKKKFCETNDQRCQLESMKLIEDSMLLILGDSDVPEVLDMQVGVARSSGMKNAHLMSAVLSIMDVPRRFVESRLASLDEEQERAAEKAGDAARSAVANKIGISKGVGAIDVLAFLIALFTMKESELLCLLTPEQFENLEAEYPDGFFSSFTRELTIDNAVNRVTDRAYDAYQLFRHALSKQGGSNTVPVSTE